MLQAQIETAGLTSPNPHVQDLSASRHEKACERGLPTLLFGLPNLVHRAFVHCCAGLTKRATL